jgi:hypothetical protein
MRPKAYNKPGGKQETRNGTTTSPFEGHASELSRSCQCRRLLDGEQGSGLVENQGVGRGKSRSKTPPLHPPHAGPLPISRRTVPFASGVYYKYVHGTSTESDMHLAAGTYLCLPSATVSAQYFCRCIQDTCMAVPPSNITPNPEMNVPSTLSSIRLQNFNG